MAYYLKKSQRLSGGYADQQLQEQLKAFEKSEASRLEREEEERRSKLAELNKFSQKDGTIKIGNMGTYKDNGDGTFTSSSGKTRTADQVLKLADIETNYQSSTKKIQDDNKWWKVAGEETAKATGQVFGAIGSVAQQGLGAAADVATEFSGVARVVGSDLMGGTQEEKDKRLQDIVKQTEDARKTLHSWKDMSGNNLAGVSYADEAASRIASGQGDAKDYAIVGAAGLDASLGATQFLNPTSAVARGTVFNAAKTTGLSLAKSVTKKQIASQILKESGMFGGLDAAQTGAKTYGETGDVNKAIAEAVKSGGTSFLAQGVLSTGGEMLGNALRKRGTDNINPTDDVAKGVDELVDNINLDNNQKRAQEILKNRQFNYQKGIENIDTRLNNLDNQEYLKKHNLTDADKAEARYQELADNYQNNPEYKSAAAAAEEAGKQLEYYNNMRTEDPYVRQVDEIRGNIARIKEAHESDLGDLQRMVEEDSLHQSSVDAFTKDKTKQYELLIAEQQKKLDELAVKNPEADANLQILDNAQETVTKQKMDAQDQLDYVTQNYEKMARDEADKLANTPNAEKIAEHKKALEYQKETFNKAIEKAKVRAENPNTTVEDVDSEVNHILTGSHPLVLNGASKSDIENKLVDLYTEKSHIDAKQKSVEIGRALSGNEKLDLTMVEKDIDQVSEDMISTAIEESVGAERKFLQKQALILQQPSQALRRLGMDKLAELRTNAMMAHAKFASITDDKLSEYAKLSKGANKDKIFAALDGDTKAYESLSVTAQKVVDGMKADYREVGIALGIPKEYIDKVSYAPHMFSKSGAKSELLKAQMRKAELEQRLQNMQDSGADMLIKQSDLSTADARRSKQVSATEFMKYYERGRAKIEKLSEKGSPAEALNDKKSWNSIIDDAYEKSKNEWGGVTVDAHTGKPVAEKANAYALTVKDTGMESVSVKPGASKEEFAAAMEEAKTRFASILERKDSHLGVFHDADTGRIDIDPVMVTKSLDDVNDIGAYTKATGGAYHFKSGDGYWPVHVKDDASINTGFIKKQIAEAQSKIDSFIDPDKKAQYQDFTKSTGNVNNRFLKERKGAEGYETNPFRAYQAYMEAANRKINFEPFMQTAAKTRDALQVNGRNTQISTFLNREIKNMAGQPSQTDEALNRGFNEMLSQFGVDETMVGKMMHNSPTKALKGFRMASSLSHLGMSANTIVNTSQQAVFLAGSFSPIKAGEGFLQANNLVKDLAAGVVTKSKNADFKKMKEMGILEGTSRIIPEASVNKYSATGSKLVSHTMKGAYAGVIGVDRYLRMVSYYAAKSEGIAKGLDGKALDRHIYDKIIEVNQNFSKYEAPQAWRNQAMKAIGGMVNFAPGAIIRSAEIYGDGAKSLAKTGNRIVGKFRGEDVTLRDIVDAADGMAKAGAFTVTGIGMANLYSNITGQGEIVPNPFDPQFYSSPAIQFITGNDKTKMVGVIGFLPQQGDKKDENGNNEDLVQRRNDFFTKTLAQYFIPGYSQGKRTLQAMDANNKGFATNDAGNIQYQVDHNYDMQRLIFGKYSTPEGRQYIEDMKKGQGGGALNKYQTEDVMSQSGAMKDTYYKFFKAADSVTGRSKVEEKIDQLYAEHRPEAARRVAAEFNKTVDEKLAEFMKQNPYISGDLEDKITNNIKITITDKGNTTRIKNANKDN